jgi:ABC-type cobalamin/Fe3+-siderophores transport system ATPase subunit
MKPGGAALHATGMAALRDHSVLTLSGGELQRAFLAQLLAQDPSCCSWTSPPITWTWPIKKRCFI